MIKHESIEWTIRAFHQGLQEGTITCEGLVEAYLSRIEAYDQQGPKLNAVIHINSNALEEARQKDLSFQKNGFEGPLHGVPVLLKDNVDTDNMPTTAGSKSLEGFIPEQNAFIVDKMLAAGAIIIAKTNLHEFAIWGETISSMLGQTLNPYDGSRTPGGSSGGTGAAVAANFGLVGIGTDTINSIRSPASANNLVGFRPTVGLVSKAGVVPYSYTQDAAGPITRTVEDAAIFLDTLRGYDPRDGKTAWSVGRISSPLSAHLKVDGLKGKRVGVLTGFFGQGAHHMETNRAVRGAMERMESGGASLVTIDDPIDSGYLVQEVSVHLHDFKDHLNLYLGNLPQDAPVHSVVEILEGGKYHAGIEDNLNKAMALSTDSQVYRDRLVLRMETQDQVMKLMAKYGVDALVYPHQKQLVCHVGGSQNERNGVLGSVTGFPSICVPAGFSSPTESAPLGVPIGMEILGRPFTEEVLVEIAYGYEQVESIRKAPKL